MNSGISGPPYDHDEDDDSDLVFNPDVLQPGEPYLSLEELEEGYGDDSEGPDYDGYTAKERELREIGGVAGMSMEIIDSETDYDSEEDELSDSAFDLDD